MQAGREGPQAPDATEVVDPDRALDDLGIDVEKAPPCGDAGVVHEEVDGRVALEDACGDLVHLRAIGDIADLPLADDLSRYPLELVGASGEQDAVPALAREFACNRLADTGRGAGDNCDALAGHGARH